MIIFDLDGTLADLEHRRHFVDHRLVPHTVIDGSAFRQYPKWYDKESDSCIVPCDLKWQPDWKSFYEACDKDNPIPSTVELYQSLIFENYLRLGQQIEIWSGRCQSVGYKTGLWLELHVWGAPSGVLKMRPIGDNTPLHELKERWLLDHLARGGNPIDFVFDSDHKSIQMWRRRGIFVFNCCQNGE